MGFLTGWRVCPRCGGDLENKESQAECHACGSVYYAQSAPAASALVVDDAGRVLLARRAFEPDAGLWDLVGGFLEESESPLDGMRREVLEETSLEVEPGAFLGSFLDTYGGGDEAASVLNLVWEARIVSGEPRPADDVAELRWFPLDALPEPEALAFRWVAPFLAQVASARPLP
jgi:8-oxo-dGTP diphosphatase